MNVLCFDMVIDTFRFIKIMFYHFQPPAEEERTENTIYYWDLIPIINLTKIIIYIVKPQETLQTEVTLSCLLHPTQQTSYPILMYLFNYMLFIEQQIEAIKPYEDEILEKLEKVHTFCGHS